MINIELTKHNAQSEYDADDDLVTFLRSVPCQLLKTGFRPVEMKYFFCSCDPEMKEPICEDCKERCHKEHVTIKTEEIEAICTCGMKCHSIRNESETVSKNYSSKCAFSEFSKTSGLNLYYEHTEEEKTVCMFCYNFCGEGPNENVYNSTPRNGNFVKRSLQIGMKEVPECTCTHKNHKELKYIYGKIKHLSTEIYKELEFENLTQTHLLNLILLSPKSFDNIYRTLSEGLELLDINIKDTNYQFEDFLAPTCEFNLALESISKLSSKSKHLEYFAGKICSILPSSKVICQILERKFDHKLISIWNLKFHLLTIFINFVFRKDFRALPNFKISGIENLNPLQRLLKVKVIQEMDNPHLPLIDSFLSILSKINHIRDKQPETYHVIYRCYQLFKFYAKFCLYTHEQLHKFFQINDEVIMNFSDSTKSVSHDKKRKHLMIDHQIQILSPMIKSIRYIIFHYNDQFIESLLKSEIAVEKVTFYHSASDLCKHINKNTINVLTHIRYLKKKELDIDKDKILHKIISQTTKIIAMNMNDPDYYSTGLQRLFDKNKEIYLKYIYKIYDQKEKEFFEYNESSLDEIDKTYQKYFEFKSSLNDVTNVVKNTINGLFENMGLKTFTANFLNVKKIDVDLNDNDQIENNDEFVILNKTGERKKFYPRKKTNPGLSISSSFSSQNKDENIYKQKYKVLINKSYYINSVLKVIKICQQEHVCKYKSDTSFMLDPNLFEAVIKFISFYVEDNVDNSMFFLTNDFVEMFLLLNGTQLHSFIELLEYVLFQIMKSQYEFSSNFTILKLISNAVKKCSDRNDSLPTMEKIVNIIKYLNKIVFIDSEHTNNKLRGIIKNMYNENPIFDEFKWNLIGDAEKLRKNETGNASNPLQVEKLNTGRSIRSGNDINIKSEDLDNRKLLSNNFSIKSSNSNFLNLNLNTNMYNNLDEINLQILNNIMRKLFEIINYLFDGDATLNEITFLERIISPEEIPKVLKQKNIDLKFRTELLKFYRMVYIDVVINSEKIDLYRNLIINPPKPSNEEEGIETNEVFKLYEELININKSKIGNLLNIDTAILKFELKYFEEIIQLSNRKFDKEKIIEYLEQGIIMPLIIHINKFMCIIQVLEVEEFLKLYEMVYYFLKLKEYVMINSAKLFENERSEFKLDKIFKNSFNNFSKTNNLIKNNTNQEMFLELQADLEEMNYQNFEILNFGIVYALFEKHLNNFINKPIQKSLGKIFQKKDCSYSEEKIEKMKKDLTNASMFKTEYEKKVFDVIIKYHNEKYKLDESYFLQSLDEENTHYAMKYRNLLIRGLLFLISDPKSALRYSRISLWAIFRLLQYDTTNVQKSVYELYEQKSDLLDLHEMVNIFFTNSVTILFTSVNPSSAILNFDYYTAMTIVKLLKYLCEEHNAKFQKIFFQEIRFKYVPDCYQANFSDYRTKMSTVSGTLSSAPAKNLNSNPVRNKRGSMQAKNKLLKLSRPMEKIIEDNNETNGDMVFKKINSGQTETENENENIVYGEVTLFDFMLKILGKIVFLANWEKIDFDEDEKSVSYYYDIFNVINELIIEMIQGTEKSNLESISDPSFEGEEEAKHFTEYLNSIKTLLFRDKHNSTILLKVRKDIMDFIMAFLEEKSTPNKLVTIMSDVLHPNNIIEAIVNVMKKLYIQENNLDQDYKEIEFGHVMCKYFCKVYFQDVKFCGSEEFELANRMYQYLKLLATNEKYSHEDAINIIESATKYPEAQILKSLRARDKKSKANSEEEQSNFLSNNNELIFDDAFYETYFCVKFFERITRTVLVQLEDSNDPEDENLPVRVIFTLNPLVMLLSDHTRVDFYDRVNRDGRYIKLYSLMEQSDQFYDEIKYNSEKSNPFLKWLNSFNYYWFSVFAFFLALLINAYMVATLRKQDIVNGNPDSTPVLNGLTYFDITFNSLVVICWFYSKFPWYLMIEQKKFLYKNSREEIGLLDYFPILFNTIIVRNEINTSVWNLIFATIGVINPNYNFVYSVQLFGIVNLSVTLKNIIRSVTMKYRQLANTIMLMFLVCYIFASIAFFYFSEDFIYNIFDPKNPLVPTHAENLCGTLIYCFIVHVDIGIRWDGGVGEYLNKRSSFTTDSSYYVGRFFYEDIYFIFVNFVILSIIFGIIIDAFAELRDQSLRDENDKKNVCFICEATREQLEKKCKNFNEHVENEHNIWTYVDYMIGLKFVDVQDCNAVNSFVYEQVEMKQIAWFPVEKNDKEEHEQEGEEGQSDGSTHE